MPVPSPLSTSLRAFVLVVLLVGGMLSAVAAGRWYASGPAAPTPPAPGLKVGGAAAPSPPAQPVKVISLKLTRRGFVPASLTVPKGDYFLTVLNGAGLDGLDLRLEREGGPRVREGKLSKEKLRWNERVELHPGVYVLTEAAHPGRVCRINVTPHYE